MHTDRNEETFSTWNKVATLYQEMFMDLELYNHTYDAVLDALPAGANLLDVGCGPGNITRYLLRKRPDLQILGIDMAPNMIVLAQKNNPRASFRVLDSRQLSTLTDAYHAIVCGFCLPYLSGAETATLISNSYGLLHPGGLLYLSFVEGPAASSGYKASSTGLRTYFYYHQEENLRQQLTGCGFEDIQACHVPYTKAGSEEEMHTTLTAKKQVQA